MNILSITNPVRTFNIHGVSGPFIMASPLQLAVLARYFCLARFIPVPAASLRLDPDSQPDDPVFFLDSNPVFHAVSVHNPFGCPTATAGLDYDQSGKSLRMAPAPSLMHLAVFLQDYAFYDKDGSPIPRIPVQVNPYRLNDIADSLDLVEETVESFNSRSSM